MQEKEVQSWGYCHSISGQGFKKQLAYGKGNWHQQQWDGISSHCATTVPIGEWSENEDLKHELEQAINKIVLILGNDEVRFSTEKAIDVLRENQLSQGRPCEATPWSGALWTLLVKENLFIKLKNVLYVVPVSKDPFSNLIDLLLKTCLVFKNKCVKLRVIKTVVNFKWLVFWVEFE